MIRTLSAAWEKSKASDVASELALVGLVVLAYGRTLSFGYIWDDHMLVQLDWHQALERSFQGLHVRPIWYLSYVLTQQLFASAVFEHFVNLALFALATVLAHRLARTALASRRAAWLVTLVWVWLPWNAYPVIWIAQRNDLLLFVFGFAAVLAIQRDHYRLAWGMLALALFSKVTAIALPVFFVWMAYRRGRRRWALAFGALGALYLTLALRAYVLHLESAAHLEPLSWGLQILRFPGHWLEHLVLLAMPLPFFLSGLHALIYGAGALGLWLSSSPSIRERSIPDSGLGSRDVLGLAFLASLAAVVTPELRICGFESLFWLLALAQKRRVRALLPAALALATVLAAYGASIAATQAIFDTRSTTSEAKAPEERSGLYPNDYYQVRREFLTDWAAGVLKTSAR